MKDFTVVFLVFCIITNHIVLASDMAERDFFLNAYNYLDEIFIVIFLMYNNGALYDPATGFE
jgi:hypothetical protein